MTKAVKGQAAYLYGLLCFLPPSANSRFAVGVEWLEKACAKGSLAARGVWHRLAPMAREDYRESKQELEIMAVSGSRIAQLHCAATDLNFAEEVADAMVYDGGINRHIYKQTMLYFLRQNPEVPGIGLNFSNGRVQPTQEHLSLLDKLADKGRLEVLLKQHGITTLHLLWKVPTALMEAVATISIASGCNLEARANCSYETAFGVPHVSLIPISGGTPLHWAVAQKSFDAVQVLLRLGADPYSTHGTNETPWSLAVRGRMLTILQAMVDISVCTDHEVRRQSTSTGLMAHIHYVYMSCGKDHVQQTVAMLQYLKSIDALDIETALRLSVRPGCSNPSLLKALIPEEGSQPLGLIRENKELLQDLLVIATSVGEQESVKHLLRLLEQRIENGIFVVRLLRACIHSNADVDIVLAVFTLLYESIETGFDIGCMYAIEGDESNAFITFQPGRTLLHDLFANGRINIVEYLSKGGRTNFDAVNRRGEIPLAEILNNCSQYAFAALRQLNTKLPDFLGQHTMILPEAESNIFHFMLNASEMSISHGRNLDQTRMFGAVIDHLKARDNGASNVMTLLNAYDTEGRTPLHCGAVHGYWSAIERAIKEGADPQRIVDPSKIDQSKTKLTPEVCALNRSWDEDYGAQALVLQIQQVAMKMIWEKIERNEDPSLSFAFATGMPEAATIINREAFRLAKASNAITYLTFFCPTSPILQKLRKEHEERTQKTLKVLRGENIQHS